MDKKGSKTTPQAEDSSSSPSSSPPYHVVSNSARNLSVFETEVRRVKGAWFYRAPMEQPESLVVPPFVVPGLSSSEVPPDPTEEALATLDPFTQALWRCHLDAVDKNQRKTLYSLNSLMPDSYYMHVVKEIHQRGHLERCGLLHDNPVMYKSISNKFKRNARFMLLDLDHLPASATNPTGLGGGAPAPVLYAVKREYMLLARPTPDQCQRVIPISQVQPLLEQLHRRWDCRVTGLEVRISNEYACVTRDACRYFTHFCIICKEMQVVDHKLKVFRPIISLHARHRYVIDLIQMQRCHIKPNSTYEYILTMVDHFSRYWWTAPLEDKTAAGVVSKLRAWCSITGKPDICQFDNGMEFAAEEVKVMCQQWGVRKRHSRPYKPSTNGSVERANQDVQQRLGRWAIRNPGKPWADGLSSCTVRHNFSFCRSHRKKPVDVFGQAKPTPEQLQPADETMLPVEDWSDEETDTDLGADGSSESESDEEELSIDGIVLEGVQAAASSKRSRSAVKVGEDKGVDNPQPGPGSARKLPQQQVVEVPKDVKAESESGVGKEEKEEKKEKQEKEAKEVKEEKVPPTDADTDAESVASMQHPYLDPKDNEPDEPSPPTDELHMVPPDAVQGMHYPQWKRVGWPFWDEMGRAGVVGAGDCGVIAALAAHGSFCERDISTNLSPDVIAAERQATLTFLQENERRIAAEERMAFELADMRAQIAGRGNHVPVEFFWLYAMRHRLNIYLVEVVATRLVAAQRTATTFSIRLITPERLLGSVVYGGRGGGEGSCSDDQDPLTL